MSDFSSVFIWWLVNLLLGLICLPITVTIFKRFFDKGYIFSKVIGIVLASYIVWLGGSFHMLPFSKITILIILIGLAIINLWVFSSRYKTLSEAKLPWKWFLLEEILFLFTLSFWSYVKATEPSIRGLEKFMDFGFVNSILRTTYFPPLDMWLTKSPDYAGGYSINYYYYGHYIAAFLTKLSGIDSVITYNLMIAALFAYTFTLSFSIGANLYYLFMSFRTQSRNLLLRPQADASSNNGFDKLTTRLRGFSTRGIPDGTSLVGMTRILLVGLLAGFLVALGGNLHTLYIFTSGYPNESPTPPWKLSPGFNPEKYWYPNATRFIPFTIHEFPIYSFVVSDLHGHVSDIPLVLLSIAILLAMALHENKKSLGEDEKETSFIRNFLSDFEKNTSIPFYLVVLLGFLLAMMYMTNAWDGMIYMILAGLVFLYVNFRNNHNQSVLTGIYKTFSVSLFLLFFFLVASVPFSFHFKPFVSGIGILCPPSFLADKKLGPFLFEKDHCQKSPLYQLATLWGFFYFNVIGYLLLVIIPSLRNQIKNNDKNVTKEQAGQKINQLIVSPRLISLWLKNCKLKIKNSNSIDIFVLLLIFISTLLLIFPEFLYMKDIYPAHYRANTMFKLGYQAFMMLGLCSAYILFRIGASISRKTLGFIIYRFFFMLLFTLVAIYPYFAINSYFGGLKVYHGLPGLNWMASQYPDDYQAVLWLRQNIYCQSGECENQPVIVEANGDSYTDYARVSANTGLPTIIGWPVHEWLWRGSYDEAGRRIPEVAAIYESKDLNATKEILKKYNVEYIFVGALEKEKYKNLDEEKIKGLGKAVFEAGGTRVYKVNLL